MSVVAIWPSSSVAPYAPRLLRQLASAGARCVINASAGIPVLAAEIADRRSSPPMPSTTDDAARLILPRKLPVLPPMTARVLSAPLLHVDTGNRHRPARRWHRRAWRAPPRRPCAAVNGDRPRSSCHRSRSPRCNLTFAPVQIRAERVARHFVQYNRTSLLALRRYSAGRGHVFVPCFSPLTAALESRLRRVRAVECHELLRRRSA